jgi:hypothetical protein
VCAAMRPSDGYNDAHSPSHDEGGRRPRPPAATQPDSAIRHSDDPAGSALLSVSRTRAFPLAHTVVASRPPTHDELHWLHPAVGRRTLSQEMYHSTYCHNDAKFLTMGVIFRCRAYCSTSSAPLNLNVYGVYAPPTLDRLRIAAIEIARHGKRHTYALRPSDG